MASKFDTIKLQDRDIALLCGLFESRIMTAAHVVVLYFEGKREYTKKRLVKLKAAGFIGERPRRVNEPSILYLTRKGFILLEREGHLSGYPRLGANSFESRANVSERTIRHELEVMSVKAALHAALAKTERFSLREFSTWPLLHEFYVTRPSDGKSVLVKPDGFIRIHEAEAGAPGYMHDCFLEVDRSNEVQETLVEKAICYLDHYRTGAFAERNGGTRSKIEDFPFRVLMVFKSAERRNNTAERLAHNIPPILTHSWLTTFAEATADPLGAIWIQPKGYRDVTAGTPFDGEKKLPVFEYRRNGEREAFIESRISKLRLLE